MIQSGSAILEAGVIMTSVLSMLLIGWGALDVYQQGLSLAESVDRGFYERVIAAYEQIGLGLEIRNNREGLERYLNEVLTDVEGRLQLQGIEGPELKLRGVIIEAEWRADTFPVVSRVLSARERGSLSVPASSMSALDLERMSGEYLTRLIEHGVTRGQVLRPDINTAREETVRFLSDSFLLIGIGAARRIAPGVGRYIHEGYDGGDVLVRSAFKTVRKDL